MLLAENVVVGTGVCTAVLAAHRHRWPHRIAR
jgi:hypothetical protein